MDGWIHSFVKRHPEKIFEIKSLPQENRRLEVPRVLLEAAVEEFRDHIHHSSAELVCHS
jgi:hypothetical protein